MAAAFEGCAEGIPSIGFSIDDSDKDADFSYCEEFVTKICKDVLAKGLDNGVCLNVNFPIGEIKGLKVCHQAKAYWNEELVEYCDPSGKPYYWLSGVFNCLDDSPQADYRVLEKSYASLVPMQVDFTAYSCLNNIKERFEDVEER
jgi:5'-nucleotidase